jgi:hypothetical protein
MINKNNHQEQILPEDDGIHGRLSISNIRTRLLKMSHT